jgi:hypothetical protein
MKFERLDPSLQTDARQSGASWIAAPQAAPRQIQRLVIARELSMPRD